MVRSTCVACLTAISFLLNAVNAQSVPRSIGDSRCELRVRAKSPKISFAVSELKRALQQSHGTVPRCVTLSLDQGSPDLAADPEGFRVEVAGSQDARQIEITASDPAGLMYGGLEVAEIIRTLGVPHVQDSLQRAHFAMRGTKFNIPLDVRTPSYTDACAAAQVNIPEMWSFDFWRDYIDTLARYRYNYVSLWSLHPFPSMVEVPEYPDIALSDVWRSRADWQEHYALQATDIVSEELLSDIEVIAELSIQDKIDFWRKVMAYGKTRNVDFYVVTWNIYTNGVLGKYGITDRFDDEKTVEYFRCSVRAMLQTYPDLAGIGLTTGENMHGVGFQAKEDWAMATYGQGVLDALKEQPNRRFRFIHRQHFASAEAIARTFQPLVAHPNIDFIFSFKYAKAHVYSATEQPYHQEFVDDLGEMETIWTLRNDDIYHFRWGAPDFVREFVKNIPIEPSRGYYYGSDQYVWGREFLERSSKASRPIEIDKHWMQWLLWGRMAFDPALSNTRIAAVAADRFGLSIEQGQQLLQAWQHASMIYPVTTGFHWGALDFQWYIEGCQSREAFAENETGFHDVNRFISLKPHKRSGYQSIPEFVHNPKEAEAKKLLTPWEVADLLDQHVEASAEILGSFPQSRELELRKTVQDIQIVTHLGRYYADKIRGATSLALFRKSGKKKHESAAITHLVHAGQHWFDYATVALRHYKNPLWTNRVGHVDWRQNYQHVLEDVRLAGGDPLAAGLPPKVIEVSESVDW